jgi:NADP-dependent 3-hydroxy acid dehydrogenase YdfG
MNPKFLTNQVALVTGASRGLGKAIALALAAEGASIAAVARSEDALKDTVETIRASGGTVEPYAVDVADSASVDAAVEKIAARFQHIDILVNNAGVTRDGLLARMTGEAWDAVINTNLKGAFHLTRPVGRLMVKQRSGRIVNISSVIGLMGNAGQANYAASKPRLHRHRHDEGPQRRPEKEIARAHPAPAPRKAGGHRRRGRLPLLAGRQLYHRTNLDRGRRYGHVERVRRPRVG